MIRFDSDYVEGAHPEILKAIADINMEQCIGYSEDKYSDKARELIRNMCGTPDADVHFLVGGTQTNTVVIKSILRPHQGVLCADTGHINVHETGAIESTGHKVLSLPSKNGKITARQVLDAYHNHWNDENHEHMVQPGMVYISFSTEVGTLYSKAELTAMYDVCRQCHLPLFIDGARLGYGLTSEENDVTLKEFASLCDVFYIGGTKCGTLFGEALVIVNPGLKQDFRYMIKQDGGLLAKGFLLGIQFLTLLQNDLYFNITRHANRLAYKLRDAFHEKGYSFFMESPTNQQFPILPNRHLKQLSKKYAYSFWTAVDNEHSAVRFCTDWATTEENVDKLIEDIKKLD